MPITTGGLRPDPLSRPRLGDRLKQRVQVEDPRLTERLTPAASPVDVYSRPEQSTEGTDLLQLAEALSSINPALKNYSAEREATLRQEADADARMRLAGMTFDEAKEAVKSGQIAETENPWFKAAFMRQYGTRMALWRADERLEVYETDFDKDQGDVEALLAEGANEDDSEFGSDPFFRAGYGEAFTRFADQLRAKHGEYQTTRVKEETVEGASTRFLDVALQGIGAGQPPETVNAALRSLYEGNSALLGLSPREQDQIVLGVAERLAQEGHYAYVKEILTSDRGGIGSIANKASTSTDAYRILAGAEAEERRRLAEANGAAILDLHLQADEGRLDEARTRQLLDAGVLTPAGAASMIGASRSRREALRVEAERAEQRRLIADSLIAQDNGLLQHVRSTADNGALAYLGEAKLWTESDITGGAAGPSKSVSVDDQISLAVNDYFDTRSPAIAKERGETPEQTLAREANWLTRNGVTYDKWERILTNGYQNATVAANAGGDLKLFEDAYSLYKNLHAQAPNLAAKLIKDRDALDFYETVRVGERNMGLTAGQAVTNAVAILTDPGKMQEVSSRLRPDQINAEAPNVSNKAQIASEMERMVRVYVAMGSAPQEALKLARERIDSTYTEVNGRLVYLADQNLPPDFGSVVEDYLEEFVKQFPEDSGIDVEDVSVATHSSARGVLIPVNPQGIPISDRLVIRTADVIAFKRNRDETAAAERAKEKAADAVKRSQNRYQPWIVLGEDTFIGPFNWSGYTPEEVEKIRQNAAERAGKSGARPVLEGKEFEDAAKGAADGARLPR